MKATAAVYFLLLTLTAWFSIVHSTCSCPNETSIDIYEFKSCPLPSIFAPQQSTYPITLPLLTFNELLQHLSNNSIHADVHPFEDLWEYISFVDGSSVHYLIEEFDGYLDAPFISDIKDSLPTVSEMKESATSIVDAIEEKVSPVISAVKDAVAPVLLEDEISSIVSKVEDTPIIIESYKYGLEYTKKASQIDVEEVEEESLAADDTCPTLEEIKRANYNRMLQSIFKFLSVLAFGLVGILTMLYFFVLSIVIYVYVKDYFAERFDADANEHFRQLLNQIRQQHQSLRRPKLVLPLPPPPSSTKKDQEQQTEAADDASVADFFYLVEQAEAEHNEDGCSSEADVSMDDTTSHSCA